LFSQYKEHNCLLSSLLFTPPSNPAEWNLNAFLFRNQLLHCTGQGTLIVLSPGHCGSSVSELNAF